jgi:hypothetical protein
MISGALDWRRDFEGSTRAVGLLRIGLALVIWSRFVRELALFSVAEVPHLILSTYFFSFTTLMLVGLYTRIAVPMVALTLAVMYFVGGHSSIVPTWNAHHIYLLVAATAFLALTPCDRSYSVDRHRAIRHAERSGLPIPEERGHLWGQGLIVLQLAALYFWTAYDKTGSHFLSGDRLEHILTGAYSGRPVEGVLLSPLFFVAASVAVVAAEYFLAIGVVLRPLHAIAVPLGLSLHATFYLLLPVNTYSISMMLLYIAVLDPDVLHRAIDRLHGHATKTAHHI